MRNINKYGVTVIVCLIVAVPAAMGVLLLMSQQRVFMLNDSSRAAVVSEIPEISQLIPLEATRINVFVNKRGWRIALDYEIPDNSARAYFGSLGCQVSTLPNGGIAVEHTSAYFIDRTYSAPPRLNRGWLGGLMISSKFRKVEVFFDANTSRCYLLVNDP